MDSGKGYMEPIDPTDYEFYDRKFKEKSRVFQIGEEIEIKGSWFRVKKINPFGIMLKVLPSKPRG